MSKSKSLMILFAAALLASGCSHVTEFAKTIWGTSTKSLEEGRATALQKTYRCSVDECFAAVLKLTEPPKEDETKIPITPPTQDSRHLASVTPTNPAQNIVTPDSIVPVDYLELFLKNRKKNLIVVMGVSNCVNTTEVGIFFTPVDQGNVRIELSSLSTKAKKNASELVFKELSKHFPEIE
jgi:hypothetical protein